MKVEGGKHESTDKCKLTYLDCWHFIAPLIPVTDDKTSQMVYTMVFLALREAEKQRVETEKRKKCEEK